MATIFRVPFRTFSFPSIPSRLFRFVLTPFCHVSTYSSSRQPGTVGPAQVCSVIRGTRSNLLVLPSLQKAISCLSFLQAL
jgi:hypothetical protein